MILNPEVKLYYYLTQEFIFQPLTLRLLYLIKKYVSQLCHVMSRRS